MTTGTRGTFVISWNQSELDGVPGADPEALGVGSVWRWNGEAVRMDTPQGPLLLDNDISDTELRKRAAQMVRRLMGPGLAAKAAAPVADPEPPEHGFVVTDGRRSYTVTTVELAPAASRLLVFLNEIPPPGTDLWIVRKSIDPASQSVEKGTSGGVICFTPGTRISTPDGQRPVQDLRAGDLVQTKDDGAQEILWVGSRRMTGARLHAMPHLRPVRIRAGALGIDIPDGDLIVSPQHRILVQGRAAQVLFSSDEVLIAAQDLINDRTISVDHGLREVTYVHLLLERHQILWANRVETESFHPANAALETLDPVQRQRLLALSPELAADPHRYGDYARRNLSASEAAILRHDGGLQIKVA